ncbi:MAG TPA: hypothetical protein VIR03_00550 [Candidatus Saccharimonadales bacterium]
MQRLKVSLQICSLAACAAVLLGFALPAYANSNDETAMAKTSQAVEALWSFVDSTGSLPDDQFYAQFADRASTAQGQVKAAYDQLASIGETGGTRSAVEKVRQDIGKMIPQIYAWRQAALSKDINTFESANSALADTVDQFNTDVDRYNAMKDGNKTAAQIAGYASAPAFAFLACMLAFALAVLKNTRDDDVVHELYRRLRWQAAFSLLAVLIGTLFPLAWYIWTPNTVPLWMWLFTLPGAISLLIVLGRFAKLWWLTARKRVSKKKRQRAD